MVLYIYRLSKKINEKSAIIMENVIKKRIWISMNITISQGREALVGSLFLCESALHATKPPKPTPKIVELILYLCQDNNFIKTEKI
jgi:hypothetical protein